MTPTEAIRRLIEIYEKPEQDLTDADLKIVHDIVDTLDLRMCTLKQVVELAWIRANRENPLKRNWKHLEQFRYRHNQRPDPHIYHDLREMNQC